jgi:NhaP-type Na+/H+ or K+/H+ antiporter
MNNNSFFNNDTSNNIINNPQNNNNNMDFRSLSINTIIATSILLIYILSRSIFKKINFYYIHESGLCMLIGMFLSTLIYYFSDTTFDNIKFDQDIFFTFILPPIIFSAGYNIHFKNFFKYFHYSIFFGIFGTFINFLLIVAITSIINFFFLFGMKFTFKDILLFSSVISATDTLSPLCYINENANVKLYEVLFGEGIFNDSMSITLYQIISKYYEIFSTSKFFIYFLFLFLSSLLLGICIGLLATFFLKILKKYNLDRSQEIIFIIIFAFISYILAEILNLSSILSLLFCSMTLNNYAIYNLSKLAREESCIVVKIMSDLSEGFVFTYLGLSFFTMAKNTNYNFIFIIVEFFSICFSRILTVYLLTGIINIFNFNSNNNVFNDYDKKIISLSGLIRGAIAFGLSLSIDTGDVVKNGILFSTTLLIVFFTTIFFGTYLPFKMSNFSLNLVVSDGNNNREFNYRLLEGKENNNEINNENNENESENENDFWYDFDNKYLKPLFVYNWDEVKEEINNNNIVKNK